MVHEMALMLVWNKRGRGGGAQFWLKESAAPRPIQKEGPETVKEGKKRGRREKAYDGRPFLARRKGSKNGRGRRT